MDQVPSTPSAERPDAGGAPAVGPPSVRRAVTIGALAFIGVASVLLAAALWYTRPRTAWVLTDAETIRQREAAAPARDVLWQPAILLPALTSGGEEYEAKISEDGQTMFFVRGKAGGNADIYVSARRRDGWTEPRALAEINSPADDLGPEPSADGSALYFYSDRPGGTGGYDLWVSPRTDTGWGPPTNLGPAVNTPFNDYGPALTPDGATLYFASNRPRPGDPAPDMDAWPATIRERHEQRDYDLYSAPVTDRGVGDPARVEALSTPANEGAPAFSPFGDFLYFASDRAGGRGGFDIYRSRRVPDALHPPENLGDAINSAANELDPGLSMGGFALHFSSDRPLPAANPEAKPDYNLYRSYSREVFREPETVRSEIDWAAVASWLRWLLPLLLLPLLLLALLRFSQTERYRKLGLLARCLLLSMLVHALIMLAMMFWHVGNSLEGWFRPAGGTRIAINRPAGGDAIASQLRGEVTHVSFDPAAAAMARHTPASEEEAARAHEAAFEADRARAEVEPSAQPADTRESPAPEPEDLALSPGQSPPTESTRVPTPALADRSAAAETSLQVADGALPSPDANRPDQPHTPASGREAELEPAAAQQPRARTDRAVAGDAASRDPSAPAHVTPEPTAGPQPAPAARLALETPAPAARARAAETTPATPTATPTEAGARPDVSGQVAAGSALQAAPGAAEVTPTSTLASRADASTNGARPGATPAPVMLASEAPAAGLSGVAVTTPSAAAAPAVAEAAPLVSPDAVAPARVSARSDGPVVSSQFAVTPARAPLAPGAALSDAPSGSDANPAPSRIASTAPALGLGEASPTVSVQPPRERVAIGVAEAAASLSPSGAAPARAALRSDGPVPAETFAVAPGQAPPTEPAASLIGAAGPTEAFPFAARPDSSSPTLGLREASAAARITPPREAGARAMATGEALPLPTPAAPEPARAATHPEQAFDVGSFSVTPGRAAPRTTPGFADSPAASDAHPAAPGPGPARVALGLTEASPSIAVQAPRERGALAVAEASPIFEAAPSGARRSGRSADAPAAATGYSAAPEPSAPRPTASLIAAPTPSEANPRAGGPEPSRTALGLAAASPAAIPVDLPRERTGSAGGETAATVEAARAPASRPTARPDATIPTSTASLGPARSSTTGATSLSDRRAPMDAAPAGEQLSPVRPALGLAELRPAVPAFEAPAERPAPAAGEQGPLLALGAAPASAPSARPRARSERANPASSAVLAPGQTNLEQSRTGTDALPPSDALGLALPPLIAASPEPLPGAGLLAVQTPAETEAEPESLLSGVVVDAISGEPLAGATVRLDVPDGDAVVARTGPDGAYELRAGQLPDHVAVSASRRGYTPDSVNIPSAELRGGARRDFRLFPRRRNVVALEADPVVHHLGDNGWEGQINSQFQKASEGLVLDARFTMGSDQVPPRIVRAEVVLLAKGTQAQNRIRINGNTLDEALTGSPRDGSYGEFRASFPAEWLVEGENTLSVESVFGNADYDDFEFVNVQIRLTPARTTGARSSRPG